MHIRLIRLSLSNLRGTTTISQKADRASIGIIFIEKVVMTGIEKV
jgi:hypothetical protein